jgi:geranylgeranyl diphosphate synthase type II
MISLENYLGSFETYLEQNPFIGEPASLYDSANYIMTLGGKRLRPCMVLMGCDALKNSFEEALPAALAIEVFHNFTLLHDDIMDKAPLRRGKPTVHKKWNESTAILAGDMMMFRSVMLLQKLPASIFDEALTLFNKTAIEVSEGQQLDMLFESRAEVSIGEYVHMITLKTSVLLGCSFSLGALIGGATKKEADGLYEFGKNLGIAFQLHDDLLDAFAEDAAAFGKQVGGDILSHKKTYLLITALQKADGQQKQKLNYLLTESNIVAAEKVASMKALFENTGARQAAENERQYYFEKALTALDSVSLPEDKKIFFRNFAQTVMQRIK